MSHRQSRQTRSQTLQERHKAGLTVRQNSLKLRAAAKPRANELRSMDPGLDLSRDGPKIGSGSFSRDSNLMPLLNIVSGGAVLPQTMSQRLDRGFERGEYDEDWLDTHCELRPAFKGLAYKSLSQALDTEFPQLKNCQSAANEIRWKTPTYQMEELPSGELPSIEPSIDDLFPPPRAEDMLHRSGTAPLPQMRYSLQSSLGHTLEPSPLFDEPHLLDGGSSQHRQPGTAHAGLQGGPSLDHLEHQHVVVSVQAFEHHPAAQLSSGFSSRSYRSSGYDFPDWPTHGGPHMSGPDLFDQQPLPLPFHNSAPSQLRLPSSMGLPGMSMGQHVPIGGHQSLPAHLSAPYNQPRAHELRHQQFQPQTGDINFRSHTSWIPPR